MTTRVGGADALNAWLSNGGYRMRLINRGWEYRRKLLATLDPRFATITAEETTGLQYAMSSNPLFAHYQPLFTGERAAWLDVVRDPAARRRHAENQRRMMVEDRTIWLGDMTARDIGRMIEAIERSADAAPTPARLVSPASASAMLTFMRRQQAGARRLPHFIDVPVAHKTGDAGNIANDVGIIYSRSGPIVIAVMVNGVRGSLGEAEDGIGRLAARVVDHFDGASAAGAAQAAPAPATRTRRAIQPPNYKPTPSPLTPAFLIGDTLYLSGSTGGDPVSGQLVAGGFEAEMRQIMSNVQTVLKEAGMTLADVVSVTAYLADMGDFPRFNEIYREYFTSIPLPTRSTVAVVALARGARLELTMTAVRTR
jgi:reactive intermediate/imine deaminase